MPKFKFPKTIFLSKKSKSPREVHHPPIHRLPVDVLYCILDYMSPAQTAALALSSQTILNTLGRRVLEIEEVADRAEFLKLLEVHFPEHILCYQCGKFHRRREKVQLAAEDTECDKKNGEFFSAARIVNFPFSRVQEVMNRHRYGKKYGVSVEALHLYDNWFIDDREHRLENSHAKIVNNNLFIRTDIRHVYYGDGARTKENALNIYNVYCPHLTSVSVNANKFDTTKKIYIKCPECHTEIRIDMFRYMIGLWRIRFTVWYNLGDCRNPFDSQWRLVTEAADALPGQNITRKEARYMRLL